MDGILAAQAIGCITAGCAGYAAARSLVERLVMRRRKQQAKGRASAQIDGSLELECCGVFAWAIRLAFKESVRPTFSGLARTGRLCAFGRSPDGFETMVRKAGLDSSLTRLGFASARVLLALLFCAVAASAGSVFSPELAVLLGGVGVFGGWLVLPRALRREAALRSERLGSQLGEMAEVVALGLHSGLSFDRAFAMYCDHFDSGFARRCGRAHQQWTLGLVTREAALRDLAESYDSAMLARIVENTIRSLRFGTSLAEIYESCAVEARSVHKAEVEERVAKAPVKMLVPIGTLILPAMLIFVLGPIMLDLMEGI